MFNVVQAECQPTLLVPYVATIVVLVVAGGVLNIAVCGGLAVYVSKRKSGMLYCTHQLNNCFDSFY